MPRTVRGDLPDGVYHVTARGVNRCAVFADDVDRVVFLRLLAESVERFAWRCHAFCLMGTHYHLLIETIRARLSVGLHRLNGLYAQRFNHRHDRTGHLFGSRFHAWLVEDEDHLAAVTEYVLNNPVRAGLVETAQDWPWGLQPSGRVAVGSNTCSSDPQGYTGFRWPPKSS
jgi:REP element-mobilizing transposase RayT